MLWEGIYGYASSQEGTLWDSYAFNMADLFNRCSPTFSISSHWLKLQCLPQWRQGLSTFGQRFLVNKSKFEKQNPMIWRWTWTMFETIKCEESPQNPEMLFNKLKHSLYLRFMATITYWDCLVVATDDQPTFLCISRHDDPLPSQLKHCRNLYLSKRLTAPTCDGSLCPSFEKFGLQAL